MSAMLDNRHMSSVQNRGWVGCFIQKIIQSPLLRVLVHKPIYNYPVMNQSQQIMVHVSQSAEGFGEPLLT